MKPINFTSIDVFVPVVRTTLEDGYIISYNSGILKAHVQVFVFELMNICIYVLQNTDGICGRLGIPPTSRKLRVMAPYS